MIAIIDYGLGNITSVLNMHRKLGIEACITSDQETLAQADKLILPGVGHFDEGMKNLNDSGLSALLNDLVLQKKKPVLGICLGAQLMTMKSEEGNSPGLGWVDADTVKFKLPENYKVPHMGWEDVAFTNASMLWNNAIVPSRYYFVHSYHFKFNVAGNVIATCNYGYEFACAFNSGNIYGVQFHPEKSHKFGMRVLENFAQI